MESLHYPREERAAFMARYAPEASEDERAGLRAQVWTDDAIDNAIQFGS